MLKTKGKTTNYIQSGEVSSKSDITPDQENSD